MCFITHLFILLIFLPAHVSSRGTRISPVCVCLGLWELRYAPPVILRVRSPAAKSYLRTNFMHQAHVFILQKLQRKQTNKRTDGHDQTYYLPCFTVDNNTRCRRCVSAGAFSLWMVLPRYMRAFSPGQVYNLVLANINYDWLCSRVGIREGSL